MTNQCDEYQCTNCHACLEDIDLEETFTMADISNNADDEQLVPVVDLTCPWCGAYFGYDRWVRPHEAP